MSEKNAAVSATVYVPAGARTNVLAIISFVASVVGLSLAGVVTGHIGLSQIKKSGEQGRGLALAGVIVGYIGLVALFFTIFVTAIFAFIPFSLGYASFCPYCF